MIISEKAEFLFQLRKQYTSIPKEDTEEYLESHEARRIKAKIPKKIYKKTKYGTICLEENVKVAKHWDIASPNTAIRRSTKKPEIKLSLDKLKNKWR